MEALKNCNGAILTVLGNIGDQKWIKQKQTQFKTEFEENGKLSI